MHDLQGGHTPYIRKRGIQRVFEGTGAVSFEEFSDDGAILFDSFLHGIDVSKSKSNVRKKESSCRCRIDKGHVDRNG